jgi:transcriptional regulator with XRE-family HTH domain
MKSEDFVCKNLVHLRKAHRLTQKELAEVLGGMGRSNYAKLERGEVYLSIDRAAKLAALYQISLDDMVSKDLSLDDFQESLGVEERMGPYKRGISTRIELVLHVDDHNQEALLKVLQDLKELVRGR